MARYRLRWLLRRDRAGYLAVVLIVGLIGGVAMGSVAAARRTQSAFPRILAASNPSDLDVDTGSYTPGAVRAVGRLPHVRDTRAYVALIALAAQPDGFANPLSRFNVASEFVGSLNGLYISQDKVIITSGRRADPSRPAEVVVSERTAQHFGLHVGSVIPMNFYTRRQSDQNLNPLKVAPHDRVRLRVVGIGVFTDEVVQDDVDRIDRVLFSPVLTRRELRCCSGYMWTGLQLDHGNQDVSTVEREFAHLVGPGTPVYFRVTSVVAGQGERAIRPESIAAAVFGLIAALAALVLGFQALRRVVAGGRTEREILRALGASRAGRALDSCAGAGAALLTGVVLAAGVAVAVSPIAPLGQLHRLDPDPGFSADWTVLGTGAAALLAVLGVGLALLARADVTRRPGWDEVGRRPAVLAAAAPLKLSLPARTGLGFAFAAGRGRRAGPAWAAITGTVVALVILVASLAFGASLSRLVSHPALYGWTWDQELLAGAGYGVLPEPRVARLLAADPDVATWGGAYFDTVEVNGRTVPVVGLEGRRVSPPVLTGSAPTAVREIALGEETLAELGVRVGSTVQVFNGVRTVPMRVTGTVTMPAIGIGHGIHPSLGRGALLPADALSAGLRSKGIRDKALQGPNTVMIRFRPGTDLAAANRRLDRIALQLSYVPTALGVQRIPVQRPAEIVNYRTMGGAPLVLAGLLAAGAAIALVVTFSTAARRRSRDYALLKTLGFTRRQVISAVVWQSAICMAAGLLAGIPLGIAAGRVLWERFATQLYVVPQPAVPVLLLALVGVAALALAVLTAVLPGWLVARTSTARVLRGASLDLV